MEQKDVKKVHSLLSEYLKKFTVTFIYSKEDVAHQFLPRDGVMYSYVIEDEAGEITDFFSYYSLPSSVLKNDKHDKINACFSYYNVSMKHSATEIMK